MQYGTYSGQLEIVNIEKPQCSPLKTGEVKMSAKILHSLTDESPDFHKQIGCMSGIFQLFDRHHFLAGRRVNGNSHKRLPPGENGNHAVQSKNTLQKATDKNRKKVVKEKHRNSTESSRTTVSSSSCSSGFSSLEYKKAAEQEPSSSSQTISNEEHTRDLSMNQPNASMHLRRQSFDMQDLVKDSTYREARGISVKPAGKDGVGHTLKYIDSPRPSSQPKFVRPRVSGVNDSFQAPAKLRQAPWSSNEEKDGCMRLVPKDARRFSYDGRETRDTSKSTIKLKELPRLSLDSKERSIRRGCNPEIKSNYFCKDLQREDGNCNKVLDLQLEPGSSNRPSNVVAKLMGLDLSDSVSTTVSPLRLINTCISDRSDPFSRSSRATNENKPDLLSGVFLGKTQKDFTSPKRRSTDSVMKPASNSKFPIETAPWRQPHGSKGSQRSASKYQEEPIKTPKSASSVYGEMEKRLANLEFKKSGKDLRALKQILEAMQKTKEMLDDRKDQASNVASQICHKSIFSDSRESASQRNLQSNMSVPAKAKGSESPKSHKSPIIKKPAKLIEKTHSSASTVNSMDDTLGLRRLRTSDPGDNGKGLVDKKPAKDLTPKTNHIKDPFNRRLRSTDNNSNTRTVKPLQKPKVSQNMREAIPTSSSRSSGITSPRLQQRRLGLEKQSPPSTPSSNSSMTRREHTRQSFEANPPGKKLEQKETSTNTRDMSHRDDATSQQSESNISWASHTDTEVTIVHQSDSTKHMHFNQHSQKQKSPAVGLSDDRSMGEPGKASSEQPSPVSVLDSTFYRDDSPSPVKKISNSFEDDEAQNLDVVEYDPMDIALLSHNTMPSPGVKIDHPMLENLKHLIQNHGRMSSTHGESILGPLCDSTNPDHMYISDILLASAILQSKPDDKIQRKLVFDVVNEFLIQKLVVKDSFKQWFSSHKLAEGKPRGQQLFRELCSEVDQLQRNNLNGSLDDEDDSLRNILLEDFMDQAKNWTECDSEIPGVVLDVERLIFKDLITEIVSDDAVGLHGWSGGHCRQLFSERGLW
ncbi:hypothetical protein Prudu_010148 [Prunus dulcis]|uniref:DUF4378 domain-containing protein n=1 Tax=Prunus dulcis TaxID=3755 RepID=A0A4Y1R7N7_PRUDU|nr:hypothetical protein Prudu_010148 [Prunus dulcis]